MKLNNLYIVLVILFVSTLSVESKTLTVRDSINLLENKILNETEQNFENYLRLSELNLFDNAYKCYKYLIESSFALSKDYNPEKEAKLNLQFFKFYKLNGDLINSKKYLFKSLNYYNSKNDLYNKAKLISQLSEINLESVQYKKSIANLLYSSKIFSQMGKYDDLLYSSLLLALCYSYTSDSTEAESKYAEIKTYLHKVVPEMRFHYYIFRGVFYLESFNFDRAYNEFKIAENLLSKGDILNCNGNLNKYMGMYFTNVGKWDSSLARYNQAIKYDSIDGFSSRLGDYYTHISNDFTKKNDLENDLLYCIKAYNIRKRIGYSFYVASASINLGIAYKQVKNYDESLKFLLLGYNLSKNLDRIKLLLRATKNISNVYSIKNDIKNALKYLEENAAYNEILGKEKNVKEIIQHQRILEFEKNNIKNQNLEIESQQKIKRYLIFLIFTLLIISGGLIFRNYFKNRDNIRIKKQEAELEMAIEDLMSSKSEMELINKELDAKIHLKNHELILEIEQIKLIEEDISKTRDELLKAYQSEKNINLQKSELINLISHEYRTPMTIIQASADLIKIYLEKGDFDKFNNKLEQMTKTLQQMNRLIDKVLIYGKLENQKIEIQKSEINLNQTLPPIIEDLSAIDNNYHNIDISFESENMTIFSDANIFKHIMDNIISNAIKYSPNNNLIKIRVSKKGNLIAILCQDFGIGIPESDLEKIYEPFQRGKNVGNIQGTGFGLAIVRNFIHKLRGSIYIESKVTKGTSITVTFPIN